MLRQRAEGVKRAGVRYNLQSRPTQARTRGTKLKLSRRCRIPSVGLRSVRVLIAGMTLALALAFAAPAFGAPLVVIDAGHGGPYNHARYGTFLEKDATLLFALQLGAQMRAAGWDVAYTRQTDTAVGMTDIPTWQWLDAEQRWLYAADGVVWYPDGTPRDDLQARTNITNSSGADLFISIHCNGSASRRAVGTENWAPGNDFPAQSLGQYVQSAVLQQTGQHNRGAGIQGFYVTRWSNCPGLLIETGFMSNFSEGRLIADPAWRARYCRGIVNGVSRWMATEPYRPIFPRFAGTASDTAIIASRATYPNGAPVVFIASSNDLEEALAAPAAVKRLGGPLLLADGRTISNSTKVEIARLHPSRIIFVGPPAALPASAAVDAATAAGLDPSAIEQVGGTTPIGTAALLAGKAASADTSVTVVFAKGASVPECVSAGAYAGSLKNAVLLLTQGDGSLPDEAKTFLADNSANISNAVLVGGVPSSAAAGIPAIARIDAGEQFATATALARATRASGVYRVFVYSPASLNDALIAAAVAAQTDGGITLPVTGKYMSPYTRELLENDASRVWSVTVVGTYETEPALVDLMVMKGIR